MKSSNAHGLRAWLAAGVLATALCLVAASAAAADDLRFWPTVAISVPAGEQVQIKADALVETTDTGARTGLSVVRIVVLRQVSDRVAFGGGYALVHGEEGSGAAYVEHRALQELDLRLLGDAGGVLVTSRTRLEERSRESRHGVALRLRQQTRLELPLANGTVRAVMWNEYFHNLDGAAWSGPAGPGFILTFVGVRAPITRTVSIEPGYMNRITFGAAHGRIDHIGAITVGVSF